VKLLPFSTDTPVVRTEFADDAAWQVLCAAIAAPYEYGFRTYAGFIDDRDFEGLTVPQVMARIPPFPPNAHWSFMFIVDTLAITDPRHPILVVDLYEEPGRTFRVKPEHMWGVENNLSLANMDFDDFASHVDDEGIFVDFED
jgi:hypothetical protein